MFPLAVMRGCAVAGPSTLPGRGRFQEVGGSGVVGLLKWPESSLCSAERPGKGEGVSHLRLVGPCLIAVRAWPGEKIAEPKGRLTSRRSLDSGTVVIPGNIG